MKFAVLFLTLTMSLFASAKNATCVPDGAADGSVIQLLNVENVGKGLEFAARYQPANEAVILLATCGNPKDLPLVYCFFREQAPKPTRFLKFETFNPTAAYNQATLQLQVYGKNNQVLKNYVCK